jgi:hypothetical protein
MTGAQIHLIFNHFPLVTSLIALLLLSFGLFKRLEVLIKASFVLNVFAFVFTLPMYASGEGAEETVEHMEHVSLDYIHKHEEMAEKAFLFSFILAIVSVAAFFNFPAKFSSALPKIVLFASLIAFLFYSLTAHLGGRISHPELREVDRVLEEKVK